MYELFFKSLISLWPMHKTWQDKGQDIIVIKENIFKVKSRTWKNCTQRVVSGTDMVMGEYKVTT